MNKELEKLMLIRQCLTVTRKQCTTDGMKNKIKSIEDEFTDAIQELRKNESKRQYEEFQKSLESYFFDSEGRVQKR